MKKILLILPLLMTLASCGQTANGSQGGQDDSGSSELAIIESTDFLPDVGEVRLLFNHGQAGVSKFYNYCPSIFVENNEEHVYYCTNQEEGNVTDFVGYRKGSIVGDTIQYSEMDLVLGHGELGSWDSRHACDPSVIKGEFYFHGEKYNYLMAYLGCVSSNVTLNETGIAVAKKPEGPWVKCDFALDGTTKINPIVPYSDFDCDPNNWGTGQPSLVSVDKKGKVLLFTTIGAKNGTFTNIRLYDFSNIDSYKKLQEKTKFTTDGVRQTYVGDAFINNADFAYDMENRRVIMAKPRQYFGTDGKNPNFVADTIDLYYIDDTEFDTIGVGDVLFAGNNTGMSWKLIGSVNQSLTGFLRNHNTGLITDPYGHLYNHEKIGVAFTRSDEGLGNNWSYLTTYRIYATSFAIPKSYFN